jgi:hypothetical protein
MSLDEASTRGFDYHRPVIALRIQIIRQMKNVIKLQQLLFDKPAFSRIILGER